MTRRDFITNILRTAAAISLASVPKIAMAYPKYKWPLRWNRRIIKAKRKNDLETCRRLMADQSARYLRYIND